MKKLLFQQNYMIVLEMADNLCVNVFANFACYFGHLNISLSICHETA